MPMLVAVIEAPANTAGIRSTWKIAIRPKVPRANGKHHTGEGHRRGLGAERRPVHELTSSR